MTNVVGCKDKDYAPHHSDAAFFAAPDAVCRRLEDAIRRSLEDEQIMMMTATIIRTIPK